MAPTRVRGQGGVGGGEGMGAEVVGMATVYLAQDLKHDRRVAIKVLRPELAELLGAGRFDEHRAGALRRERLRARDQAPRVIASNAYHALANVQFHIRRDFVSAEENYRKALALESSAYVLFEYGWLLSQTGRHAEAVAALEEAVELDPRSPLIRNDLGWSLYGARQFERAIAEARFAIDLDPSTPNRVSSSSR